MPKYPLERENRHNYTAIKDKRKKFSKPLDISTGKDYTLYKHMFIDKLVFLVDKRSLILSAKR